MKKITYLTVLLLLGFVTMAQTKQIMLRSENNAECIKSDMESLRATFSFSDIVSNDIETEKGVFSEISMMNTYPSGEYGAPTVPAIHQLIAVPFGAEPVVTIKNFTVSEYKLNDLGINRLMPRQPSLRKDMDINEVEFVYNEAAYQKRALASTPNAMIEMTGVMRGVRVGSLVIEPVSYDAVSNSIRVFNDIEVEVTFAGADAEETERMLVNTFTPYYDVVYRQLFNYRAINDVYDDHPDLWAAPVRMIVVANDMFADALEPWLEWKTQKGFYLDVNYTSTVGNSSEAIKSFLQNKYNTGVQNNETPTFVIIVGDKAQVAPSVNFASSTQKVSDLYYGSVDNDYYPDMFYSRMSAENVNQLTAIIDKILMYEKYTMPDDSYLDNVLLIAGVDSYWNPRVAQPTINYATINYFNAAHGYANVYSYLNSYTGCYNNLSTGVGFVNYTAHGSETSWYSPSFTNSSVNTLTNTNKYFWAMGNCCLSGDWGYSIECLGEAMIRAANKAAFGYIGSCPSTYWYEDYYFNVGATNVLNGPTPSVSNSSTGVYDAMFMDETYNTLSSVTFVGNLAVCYAHAGNYQTHSSPIYYWQAYHVLGDGSVMPYNTAPEENDVTHATSFPANASTFTVSADAGSYVAISKDGELLGTALVGTTGSVNVPVTPVTSGEVMIVVTRPQRQPYIETIAVGGGQPGQPEIEFVSVSPASIGVNSNVNITVTLRNSGTAATSGNTNVTLASSDSYLTIVNGTASYPAMNANQTGTGSFTLRAASNTPNGHTFSINYTATNGSNNWQGSFTLTANNPCNAPTGLAAVAEGNNIHLSWNASSTANSYKVFRGSTLIATQTATSYTDTDLQYNTNYCYTVKSVCNSGDSNPSNQACATTENEPCYSPENLTAYADGNTVSLSWTASSSADRYRVYRDGTAIGLVMSTNYNDFNLDYNTEYCYEVTSICGDEESDPSDEICTSTESEPCNAPVSLVAEVNLNTVTLSWQPVDNAVSYTVMRDGDVIATDVTVTTMEDANLAIGTYSYSVITVCSEGQSEVSEPVEAVVDFDGISEYENMFRISPNPVKDYLIINTTEEIKYVSVYNILGIEVFRSKEITGNSISMNGMQQGIYFVKIGTAKGEIVKRIIKE